MKRLSYIEDTRCLNVNSLSSLCVCQANKFNLESRFFQLNFVSKYSNAVMELVITNFQISPKRISKRNTTFRAYRQLVIVIVKQRFIISELWTMNWKVLILSSTLLMQIYICNANSKHFYISDRCTILDVNHFYIFLPLGYLCVHMRNPSH